MAVPEGVNIQYELIPGNVYCKEGDQLQRDLIQCPQQCASSSVDRTASSSQHDKTYLFNVFNLDYRFRFESDITAVIRKLKPVILVI